MSLVNVCYNIPNKKIEIAKKINVSKHKKQKENNELKATIHKLKKEMNEQRLTNENDINNLTIHIENTEIQINELKTQMLQKNKMIDHLNANIRDKQQQIENTNKKLKDIMEEKEMFIARLNHENEEKEQPRNRAKINIFKEHKCYTFDLNDAIFTQGNNMKNVFGYTYAIIQMAWSKDTIRNGKGIHEFKLKCLESAKNAISIGMITNSTVTMDNNNKWLFDESECGVSYQLFVGRDYSGIYHHKNGKQKYEERLEKRKQISNGWKWNSYAPNDTMCLRVDFIKFELTFYINGKSVGKSVAIEPNTYYPAIAYGVDNGNCNETGSLKIKVLSLD